MRWNALLPALLLACFAAPMLGGCALQPVYAGGGSGAVAQGLSAVEIAPIPGQSGWLMRDALQQRMGTDGGGSRYRLDVVLDDLHLPLHVSRRQASCAYTPFVLGARVF